MDTPDPNLTAFARKVMPFAAELGVEILTATPELVIGSANWREERCTIGGALHGGYLMGVADAVGAYCSGIHLPPGARTTTIESRTNFFRAVTGGQVRVEASPVHVGRTVIVIQTDILRADGKLATRTLQSQAVIQPREPASP